MTSIHKLAPLALVVVALAGCSQQPESTPAPTPAPVADKAPTAPAPAAKEEAAPETAATAKPVTLSAEEIAEIKKLPPDEVDVALKQLVCPFSGENLGSMGKPFKITVENQTFYLCCGGCEKDVRKDPAAVVAKLKK
jgi:hypothetical protein